MILRISQARSALRASRNALTLQVSARPSCPAARLKSCSKLLVSSWLRSHRSLRSTSRCQGM